MATKKSNYEDKKFEELMNDLDSIVKELENGTTDLESTIENNYSESVVSEKEGFTSLSKSIITSLIDFNFKNY